MIAIPCRDNPGTRTFRLLLNCELVSAEDFNYDDLFVRFYFMLI